MKEVRIVLDDEQFELLECEKKYYGLTWKGLLLSCLDNPRFRK